MEKRERERYQKRVWVVVVSDKESFSKQRLKGTDKEIRERGGERQTEGKP